MSSENLRENDNKEENASKVELESEKKQEKDLAETTEGSKEEDGELYFGLDNLGMSCYFNSFLQIILHNEEIKEFFDSSFVLKTFVDSDKSEDDTDNTTLTSFLSKIFEMIRKKKETYKGKNLTFIPKSLYEEMLKKTGFRKNEQQDAGEFIVLFLDILHQETIFDTRDFCTPKIPEKSSMNLEDKVKFLYAYEISQESSIFNSLFSFVLGSEVTCKGCGGKSYSFEMCKGLYLPIPSAEKFYITIILHQLPKMYKFYSGQEIIDKSSDFPFRITTDFDPSKKIKDIIDFIIDEFGLEKESSHEIAVDESLIKNDNVISSTSTLVCILEKKYLGLDKTIADVIPNKSQVHIYEMLNSNGLKLINQGDSPKSCFLYKERQELIRGSTNIHVLSYSPINNLYISQKRKDNYYYEYIIPILHRYPQVIKTSLFGDPEFKTIMLMPDYVLLNNSEENIFAYQLYELIYNKFSYMISSDKVILKPWWRYNNSTHYYPFILKLINNENHSCSLCSWSSFCKGCCVPPDFSPLPLVNKSKLIVEWMYEKCNKDLIEQNPYMSIDYNIQKKQENPQVTELQECYDEFFKKETLETEIFCSECKERRIKEKNFFLYFPPKYLLITLKRFSSFGVMNTKNEGLVNFPLDDYVVQDKKYKCIAVINHMGNLVSGHYYTYLRTKNETWKCFNDKKVSDIPVEKVVNKNAYILLYKNTDQNNLFYDIINTLIKKKEQNIEDQFLIDGEPVVAGGKFGCVLKSKFFNGKYLVEVQFEDKKEVCNREKIYSLLVPKRKIKKIETKKEKKENRCPLV